MDLKKMILALTGIIFIPSAFAVKSGLDLLNICKGHEKTTSVYFSPSDVDAKEKMQKIFKASECSSYLSGVLDADQTSYCISGANQSCIPENVTFQQKVLIINKYMNDHPEKLNSPAPQLIFEGLKASFPCQ